MDAGSVMYAAATVCLAPYLGPFLARKPPPASDTPATPSTAVHDADRGPGLRQRIWIATRSAPDTRDALRLAERLLPSRAAMAASVWEVDVGAAGAGAAAYPDTQVAHVSFSSFVLSSDPTRDVLSGTEQSATAVSALQGTPAVYTEYRLVCRGGSLSVARCEPFAFDASGRCVYAERYTILDPCCLIGSLFVAAPLVTSLPGFVCDMQSEHLVWNYVTPAIAAALQRIFASLTEAFGFVLGQRKTVTSLTDVDPLCDIKSPFIYFDATEARFVYISGAACQSYALSCFEPESFLLDVSESISVVTCRDTAVAQRPFICVRVLQSAQRDVSLRLSHVSLAASEQFLDWQQRWATYASGPAAASAPSVAATAVAAADDDMLSEVLPNVVRGYSKLMQ